MQRGLFHEGAVVGGPAVRLMPEYLTGIDGVKVDTGDMPGALQRVNPAATKTTTGCIRRCAFCAVPKLEGPLVELDDWPDLPIITDNNLLGASQPHFDRVIDRLAKHGRADFNEGLDSRLLTKYHAKRLSEIKKPTIRLALDSMQYSEKWSVALDLLLSAGIAKSNIRSYALIGFDSDPVESWARCEWIENNGPLALPMWFHELDQMKPNIVTEKQGELGWNDFERRRIMQWFYWHKRAA